MNLGFQLKQRREERRLSLGALAAKSGVNKSTLSRWESGRTQPNVPELERVLRQLQVDQNFALVALQSIHAPRAIQRISQIDGVTAGGDLLKTLRLREGLSRADLARKIGVSASALGSWERGEEWPSGENLHRLAFELRATADELEVLTSPHLRLGGEGPETMERLLRDAELHLESDYQRAPFEDLPYLALERRYQRFGLENPEILFYLVGLKAWRATALSSRKRYADAVRVSDSVLNAPTKTNEYKWTQAKLVNIWAQVMRAPQKDAARGIRLMREFAPNVRGDVFKSWFLANFARFLELSGDTEGALNVSEKSVSAAVALSSSDVEYRLADRAQMLIALDRPEEALRILPEANHSYAREAVPRQLLKIEALIKAGEPRAAQNVMREVQTTLAENPGTVDFTPDVDRLNTLLTGASGRLI